MKLRLMSVRVTVPYESLKVFQETVLAMSQTMQADLTVRDVNLSPERPRRTAFEYVGSYHFKVFPEHRAAVLEFADNLYTIWKLTRNAKPAIIPSEEK